MSRLESKLKRIGNDPLLTARSIGLRYSGHSNKGYFRHKNRSSFYFVDENQKKITKKELLDRFSKLVIPPAWENVWISPYENGHLQVTGIDARGRKQYRYHPQWNKIRNQSKFYRLRQFANALPKIRKQVERDLRRPGLPYEKVMALVVSLVEQTNIRIGNDAYKKLYGSFGLTTLRDRHVTFDKSTVRFEFKGKKGVIHKISLQSRKLAQLVRRCKEIPGHELFQYYDDQGNRQTIGSADVNQYLKNITGEDFTAKDFRAWAGSVNALCAFREVGPFENDTDCRRKVVAVIDSVAEKLGNTRAVCKKYYIHPTVIAAYEKGSIANYECSSDMKLNADEKALIKLLDAEKIAEVIA